MEIIFRSEDFVVFENNRVYVLQDNRTCRRDYYGSLDKLSSDAISRIGLMECEKAFELLDAIESYKQGKPIKTI
jgi:hypothetical protein